MATRCRINRVNTINRNNHLSLIGKRYRNDFAKARRRANRIELSRRERLQKEKVDRELSEIRSQKLAPYKAVNWEEIPKHTYSSSGVEKQPFVKPINEPYPDGPFMESRPEPLLVWNDFQERYELRDKRIISEKTKKTILSMHRRDPLKNTKYSLSKLLGMSEETIDFIFWENEMREKYKIPYDLDTIKLLEAYCGTDDIVESKVYSMMAYSEVTGDPFFSSGKLTRASPLIVHEDELDEYLYSWQKKQKYRPKLSKDQYEIIPEDGSGSGKYIESEIELNNDHRRSYLIVDYDDDTVGKLWGLPMNVKVRENNGKMRWATLDELNYCREKQYPKNGWTPYNRIRGPNRKKERRFKRDFPRRPYIDRQYFEGYCLKSIRQLTPSRSLRCCEYIKSHKRFIFGPSSTDFKRWEKEFGLEEDDPDRDPRELTPAEVMEALKHQGNFDVTKEIIPSLELPQNAWYTSNHLYIQQTNLDDIWRIGISPIKHVGVRHVEWLVFDAEPGDIKLFSESLMYYSICDWRPLRIVGQSINDIQYNLSSPFHRVQIVSVNEKIQDEPKAFINDDVEINWRWLIVFRWINKSYQIFEQPPFIDGRYGRWFDEEQYIEWIKDEGLYKHWQLDQMTKLAEDKKLVKAYGQKSAKEERDRMAHAEEQKIKEQNLPKYTKLDQEYSGGYTESTWKPKWFPF